MSTLTNIPYNSKSMNGIITISDGEAIMENGDITASNINTDNINSNTHTVDGDLTVNGNFYCGNLSTDIHTVKGKMTFSDTLPESSLVPSTDNQLTNKKFVDDNFVHKTESLNESINGIKTFTVPPENSSTLTTNYQLTNKLYVDTKFNSIDLTNYVTKNGADTISGLKTFTTLPESSIVPTTNNQLSNKKYVDDKVAGIDLSNYVNLDTQQTITGLKFFNTLPRSTVTPSLGTQLITKNYADGRFLDLGTNIQSVTIGKQFSNISIGKANTTNVFDVIGNANFDTPTVPYTLTNPNFTSFTGFTAPDPPQTLQSNLNGTYTNNGWTWNGAGSNTVLWMRNGNAGLFWAGPPSGYNYQLGHYTYKGNAFYLQQSLSNLTPGNYILTFWSMWGGGSNGGSLTASLTVTMQNSTESYTYADPATRATLQWVKRTMRFTVTSSGASYIRWTPADTAVAGTLFAWAIAGVTLTYYSALLLTDTQSGSTTKAYLGSTSSILNNAYINGLSVFNSLSLIGTPSFYLPSPNTSCLVLNGVFGTRSGASNSFCLMIGDTVSPNGTSMSQCTHIGYAIQTNAANPVTSSTKSVIVGQQIACPNANKDIIIGTYIAKSGDTTGENVCIGYNQGGNSAESINGTGCGRRCVALGSDIFCGYPGTGYQSYIPQECIAIGYRSQFQTLDRYNTSVGCFSLENLYGNANLVTPNRLSEYNTAVGHQAGRTRNILNKSTLVGALSDSTVENVTNVTAIGYNAKASANYATSIGSDVTNSTANSVRIGRSTDTVQIDGTLSVGGTVTLPSNSISQSQVLNGYVDLSTNQSISGTKTFTSISIPNGYVDLANTQSIYGVKNFYGAVNVYNNFSASGNVNLTDNTLNFNTTSGTNCSWNVGPLPSSASTFPNMGVTGGPTSYQIVYCSSSRNTKQNIISISENDHMYNMNNFMKLRPIFYNPKEGCGNTSNRYIGFIAEEINDLGFEELVQFNGDAKEKIMGISYDRITVYLVKIIQEQQQTISQLENKMNNIIELLKSKSII